MNWLGKPEEAARFVAALIVRVGTFQSG